jgi:hypothetical protein
MQWVAKKYTSGMFYKKNWFRCFIRAKILAKPAICMDDDCQLV